MRDKQEFFDQIKAFKSEIAKAGSDIPQVLQMIMLPIFLEVLIDIRDILAKNSKPEEPITTRCADADKCTEIDGQCYKGGNRCFRTI